MPWTTDDVGGFTKAATTDRLKRMWVGVANSALERCLDDGGNTETCERSAIQQANAVVRDEVEEAALAERDTYQPPKAAQNNAQKVLRWREEHGDRVRGMTAVGWRRARQLASGEPVSLDIVKRMAQFNRHRKNAEIEPEYRDEPWRDAGYVAWLGWGGTTGIDWAIGISQRNQEAAMDYRELATQAIETARACVRENQIFVALAEEKGTTPRRLAEAMLDGLEAQLAERAEPQPDDAEVAEADWGKVRAAVASALEMIDAAMGDDEQESDGSEQAAIETTGEATAARDAEEGELSEAARAAAETGRRAPVVVDFQILAPGPGNSRDNHYYPANVVERDIHVFEGADVFATDHRDTERSERTKVGAVLRCPTRFTEARAPVAEVLIYDPDQAEKARNRADASALHTLECSIFGRGQAAEAEVDGQTYKVVNEITEGRFLELVSKAGAGGKAIGLAESHTGGDGMTDKEKSEAARVDVQEVDIEEAEAGEEPEPVVEASEQTPEETPDPLAADVVSEALAKSNLPEFVKVTLAARQYLDGDALESAIKDAIAEVKALTGSGEVTGLGESQPADAPQTLEEKEKADAEWWNDLREKHGLR